MSGEGIRCTIMRGGTSKGLYLLADDLSPDVAERDRQVIELMGSPDARQIDGLGGAHPLTSKVAIVSACAADDVAADVDYLFLQVMVDRAIATDRQNCGNLLAAVGPFAVERGLVTVDPDDTVAEVRIRMLNGGGVATACFPVRNGRPVYAGDCAIAGVPGTAAPVEVWFTDTAGSATGSLLPTGSAVDVFDEARATCIDNGMPVVVVAAADLGATGYESCDELEANIEVRSRVESLRLQAGRRMGLGDVTDLTVPKVTLVAPPVAGGHLSTRTFIPHRCHDAIGVLGAVSVAAAALLPGTPAAAAMAPTGTTATIGTTVRIAVEHPTGTLDATIVLGPNGVERSGIVRTARKLMDGVAFLRG